MKTGDIGNMPRVGGFGNNFDEMKSIESVCDCLQLCKRCNAVASESESSRARAHSGQVCAFLTRSTFYRLLLYERVRTYMYLHFMFSPLDLES